MKKQILSLALLVSVLATSAFAADRVTEKAEKAFKKEFPSAVGLSWNRSGDYLQATFILDGHRTIAYFREDGQFAGSMRSIFFDQLPLAASRAIDRKYEGADVMEVYEITNDEGTVYVLTLELAAKKYKVKVDGNGNIGEAEKLRK